MRILVVEDSALIASGLKKGLEQESFAVDLASDGEQAEDLLYSEEYDLIILDLMLPKKDGLTLCKELREQQITTPILMLTAKGEIEDKVIGLNKGADDYLAKPFDFEELVARVRALLRRPTNHIPTTLTLFDLELNPSQAVVFRAGQEVELSKTEFSLLEFLLRHKNQVVSKEQITQHVWPYDADVLPNTVEVYVGYLRSKLEKPFPDKKKLIQTVRGRGYMITDTSDV